MMTKTILEIKSYHYAFLRQMQWKNFPLHQDLNYLVKCETKNYSKSQFITNQGFSSSFQPASELLVIICPAFK